MSGLGDPLKGLLMSQRAKPGHSHAAPAHIVSSPTKVTEFPGPVDEPMSAFTAERTLGRLTKFLEGKNFSGADEMNAYISSLDKSMLSDIFNNELDQESDDPIERAQELAYRAMEAGTRQEVRRLAREALDLDPDCVDASSTLASTERSPEKAVEKLIHAVEVGERRLGKEFFEQNEGHFWGMHETRPYMRARDELADALLAAGRIQESIEHREALLRLCPGDNLGIRYSLMGLYLASDNLEAAYDLLEEYDDDICAVFAWARVLIHYLSREFDEAEEALADAREVNPYVEPYFIHEKSVSHVPASYVLGEESEAQFAAYQLHFAWAARPLARAWLMAGGRPGDGEYFGFFSAINFGKK